LSIKSGQSPLDIPLNSVLRIRIRDQLSRCKVLYTVFKVRLAPYFLSNMICSSFPVIRDPVPF
jgi:hypothetical protein